MKEVNLHNPAFGKDKKDRDSSVKNIVSELTIIKEQVNVFLVYEDMFLTKCHQKKVEFLCYSCPCCLRNGSVYNN